MRKNINDIKNILNKHMDKLVADYNIELIYIFGSYGKGTNKDNSDLDIAIHIKGESNGFIKLDILDELVGILNREDIDLVILNSVDTELQFQVIKYGKLIYMKDLITKVIFESNVMNRYMDMEYFRNVQNKIIHERFLETFK